MVKEDYVSFETAKLLREKGFDEPCHALYHNSEDKIFFGLDVDSYHNTNLNVDCYACPTLQMVMKWLREVYSLHCATDYDFILGWYCQITSLKETVEYDYNKEMKHYRPDKNSGLSSPEEACETAIRYCLENLI